MSLNNAEGAAKPLRGFAAMSPERRKEIAARGGSKVPAHKRAFSVDRELASKCGMVGGRAVSPEKRTFSTNNKLASEAGRKGGKKTKRNKELKNEQVDRSIEV